MWAEKPAPKLASQKSPSGGVGEARIACSRTNNTDGLLRLPWSRSTSADVRRDLPGRCVELREERVGAFDHGVDPGEVQVRRPRQCQRVHLAAADHREVRTGARACLFERMHHLLAGMRRLRQKIYGAPAGGSA